MCSAPDRWEVRKGLFLSLKNDFDVISMIKMVYWAVIRKLFKLKSQKMGKVYIKTINHYIYIRKYNDSDYGLLFKFFSSKEIRGKRINPNEKIEFILDGGANIGLFSCLYATYYPSSKIIAVECEKSNYEVLKHNSKQYNNILPVLGAVWDEDKRLDIMNPEASSVGFTVGESNEGSGGVEGFSIDSLARINGLDHFDLIKLDIEGAEFQLYKSLDKEWIKKARRIIIEIHDDYDKDGRKMIMDCMNENRFEHFEYDGDDYFERSI